jgi:hypothetical protein
MKWSQVPFPHPSWVREDCRRGGGRRSRAGDWDERCVVAQDVLARGAYKPGHVSQRSGLTHRGGCSGQDACIVYTATSLDVSLGNEQRRSREARARLPPRRSCLLARTETMKGHTCDYNAILNTRRTLTPPQTMRSRCRCGPAHAVAHHLGMVFKMSPRRALL